MKDNITGIILAGGKSKRMGTEKGLVKFQGKPLVEYAIEALKPICEVLLISSNSDTYDYLGYPVISDVYPDTGPMGGIYSCLLKSKHQHCFVLSCDTPMINTSLISMILHEAKDFDITIPWHGNEFFEPLCAVYHKNVIPVFDQFIKDGNFKIPDVLARVNANMLRTGIDQNLDPEAFFNVNSKKQLQDLEDKNLPQLNQTGFKNLFGLTKIPNLLMIAGTGRKVGKTTFACNLINQFSKSHKVVGVKISPHMHEQVEGQKVIAQTNDYVIIEETNAESQKDSSRMLRAGATTVYYLQTTDRQIKEPFQILTDLIPKDQPVICESGALLNYAKPGLFMLVKRVGQIAFKKGVDQLQYQADFWVTFDGEGFDLNTEKLTFNNNCMELTDKQNNGD